MIYDIIFFVSYLKYIQGGRGGVPTVATALISQTTAGKHPTTLSKKNYLYLDPIIFYTPFNL